MKEHLENPMNLFEVKAHLSEVVRRVEKGERITIMKNHVPVAIVSGMHDAPQAKYKVDQTMASNMYDAPQEQYTLEPTISSNTHNTPQKKYTVREAIDSILEMRKGRTLGGITIKELINEGRKW